MNNHLETLNAEIAIMKRDGDIDTNLISDGYHTFGQLYDHRIMLFIKMCEMYKAFCIEVERDADVWRMPVEDGWFLMGIGVENGEQITYHLPESKWEQTSFATLMHKDAYVYDGHTSDDVLQRLKNL